MLSRQCLGRRIHEATLRREVEALERQRNDAHATIAWLPLQLHGPLCATSILPRKIIWTNY